MKQVLGATCNLPALLCEVALHGSGTQTMHIAPASPDAGAMETPVGVSKVDEGRQLSVSHCLLMDSGSKMHEDKLKGTWRKAEPLVNDTSFLTPALGSSSSHHRMVASMSGQCPHLVTTPAKFTGQFKCDTKCNMYDTGLFTHSCSCRGQWELDTIHALAY